MHDLLRREYMQAYAVEYKIKSQKMKPPTTHIHPSASLKDSHTTAHVNPRT